jgi:uncharacterized protein (TIGR01777 family)
MAAGDTVTVLTRNAKLAPRFVHWDGRTLGSWTQEIEDADLLLNLCGRSVNCRYNAANRAAILSSRIASTRILGEAIARARRPPRVWMNASTATIYRHSLDREMDEDTGEIGGNEAGTPETWRFSIDVAKRWEEAFADAPAPFTRKIALRSAMTMSPDKGGILDVLLGLVRRGLGGRQGSGKQFVSWIHEADFVAAIEFLLANDSIEGVVNMASPHPLPNRDFMAILRAAAGVSIGISVTRWMLEIGASVMRTETELVLKSRRVVPGRLLASGFRFRFPEWTEAAHDLVERWRTV